MKSDTNTFFVKTTSDQQCYQNNNIYGRSYSQVQYLQIKTMSQVQLIKAKIKVIGSYKEIFKKKLG